MMKYYRKKNIIQSDNMRRYWNTGGKSAQAKITKYIYFENPRIYGIFYIESNILYFNVNFDENANSPKVIVTR